jgi:hypothetical protein
MAEIIKPVPEWAHKRPGDQRLWQPPTGMLSACGRAIRAAFNNYRHEPCGGVFVCVGTSGVVTHSEYYRCNRCGEQSGECRIPYG